MRITSWLQEAIKQESDHVSHRRRTEDVAKVLKVGALPRENRSLLLLLFSGLLDALQVEVVGARLLEKELRYEAHRVFDDKSNAFRVGGANFPKLTKLGTQLFMCPFDFDGAFVTLAMKIFSHSKTPGQTLFEQRFGTFKLVGILVP